MSQKQPVPAIEDSIAFVLTDTGLKSQKAKKTNPWFREGKWPEGLYLDTRSNIYYHRYSVNGKRTFRTLDTSVYDHAQKRCKAAIPEIENRRDTEEKPTGARTHLRTMGDLMKLAKARVEKDGNGPNSRRASLGTLKRIETIWPGLAQLFPSRVTAERLTEFKEDLEDEEYAQSVINKTLGVLNSVLVDAVQMRMMGINPFDNKEVRKKLMKKGKVKQVNLPSKTKIEAVFNLLGQYTPQPGMPEGFTRYHAGRSKNVEELARFLAYSGMRVSEANRIRWEDIHEKPVETGGTVQMFEVNSKDSAPPDNGGKDPDGPVGKSDSSHRWVPFMPRMTQLMDEIKARRIRDNIPLTGPILRCKCCRVQLPEACEEVGIERLTHHKLRHFFATICIESGIDIPTVSRWLGHADGGVLAMKTYGHLRPEHSAAMAAKVSFLPSQVVSNVAPSNTSLSIPA